MALTKLNNQSLTAVTSAGLPAGTVLQVKQFTTTTQTNTSSTTFVDTLLTINITPISISSKILVRVFCPLRKDQVTAMGGSIQLLRNTTAIGNQNYLGYNNAAQYGQESINLEVLDSPQTTSSLTYKVQVKSQIANNTNFGHDNGLQGITVMEIAG